MDSKTNKLQRALYSSFREMITESLIGQPSSLRDHFPANGVSFQHVQCQYFNLNLLSAYNQIEVFRTRR